MIRETLSKIEERIKGSGSLRPEAREDLTELLSTLKDEIDELARTHGDDARSITGFTEVSTHEAIRGEQNKDLLKVAVEGLAKSVDGFEKSHPKLVQVVNRICETLSNLGV